LILLKNDEYGSGGKMAWVGWGARGRGLEPRHPDFISNKINDLNMSAGVGKMPNKIQDAA
jgi:hypothetical protein